MERKHQYKHQGDTADSLREKRRECQQELRKDKRSQAFSGKRMRVHDDDNTDYEITVSDVVNTTEQLISKCDDRRTHLKLLRQAFAQGTALIDAFIGVDNSVACLVGLLTGFDANLQLDAAWCLTNMAAGTDEHATVVIKHAGAYLVTYLSSTNTPMQDQCAWAIGNLAGGAQTCRETLVAQGVLLPLIKLLTSPVLCVVQSSAFALSNLARDKPVQQLMVENGILPYLAELLKFSADRLTVITEASWVVTYLAASGDYSAEILAAGIPSLLTALVVQLAGQEADHFQCVTPAVRCVGNIVCGMPEEQVVAEFCRPDMQLLPTFAKLLHSEHIHMRKEALWVMSNFTDDDANEVVIDLSSSQSDTSSLFSPFEKDKKDTTKLSSVVDHKAQLGTGQFEGVQLRNLPKQASKVSDAKVVMHGHSPFMPPVLRGSGGKQSVRNWQTLVLFAAKLSQLDIVVNMSNVMGNTVWSMRDLTSEGRFSIDSSGYKNMKISAGLGGSKLDARGGIIGGNIEMQQLHSEISVSEDPGKEPEHMVIFDLHVLEARLDYMGSSILMGRISDLAVKLNDEWHVETGKNDDRRASSTTSRSVLVFVHGDLVWDRFHLMISRSTTPELIKMVHKLDEFISQQRTSSKRVLSVFGPASSSAKAKPKQKEEDSSWISEIRHHRHWQAVLKHMGGSHMSMLACKLPEHGTIIGGTMSLQGRNITLACFHGINFRSKSWALFTMDDPYICFATEAADVIEDGEQCTHVTQNLSFQLGQYQTGMLAEKKPMALICKLSRGHYMPPPFTSVQDWFHYAFATSEVKDLDTFPVMARLEAETNNVAERRGASRRAAEYTHDTEIIFILPSLQMHLKTEHMQGENEPQDDEPKPVVECSFVTEFEDHIFVAMDAEAVLFIHDLVINYVREKDRGSARAPRSPEVERQQQQQKLDDPTSVLKQDYRTFNCETWHLEPTVRLLSWAGKRIDPVGVDYILQKLGFQHARLTISKWMQRGCMDPLDKIVSVLVDKLIVTLREQSEEDEEQETVLAVAAAASH